MPNQPATTRAALRARLIRREDFAPCESAFVDVRLPNSSGKMNYSFIGPGVSQSDAQPVNLREPHGFQVGGVMLPGGHINNLHLHYTAEVFICVAGEWTCFWGVDGEQGEVTLRRGDLISVPTWVFRGFKNVGADDGFMFALLGGDDTGGIQWGPGVLRRAAETGLYLTRDNRLVDTRAGQPAPSPEQQMPPLSAADVALLPDYTVEQMLAARVLSADQRRWSGRALLSAVAGDGDAAVELAPAIGHGLSESRSSADAGAVSIVNPHGFSADWLRGREAAGARIGEHRVEVKQVLISTRGSWRLTLYGDDGVLSIDLGEREIYSVPAGVWRALEAAGGDSEMLVVWRWRCSQAD